MDIALSDSHQNDPNNQMDVKAKVEESDGMIPDPSSSGGSTNSNSSNLLLGVPQSTDPLAALASASLTESEKPTPIVPALNLPSRHNISHTVLNQTSLPNGNASSTTPGTSQTTTTTASTTATSATSNSSNSTTSSATTTSSLPPGRPTVPPLVFPLASIFEDRTPLPMNASKSHPGSAQSQSHILGPPISSLEHEHHYSAGQSQPSASTWDQPDGDKYASTFAKQSVLCILFHKIRGGKGEWKEIQPHEMIRVTKGVGKKVKIYLESRCKFTASDIQLTLQDMTESGRTPRTPVNRSKSTRFSIESTTLTSGEGATRSTAELIVKLFKLSKQLVFHVSVQHRGLNGEALNTASRGTSVLFGTHNSGKQRRKKDKSDDEEDDPSEIPGIGGGAASSSSSSSTTAGISNTISSAATTPVTKTYPSRRAKMPKFAESEDDTWVKLPATAGAATAISGPGGSSSGSMLGGSSHHMAGGLHHSGHQSIYGTSASSAYGTGGGSMDLLDNPWPPEDAPLQRQREMVQQIHNAMRDFGQKYLLDEARARGAAIVAYVAVRRSPNQTQDFTTFVYKQENLLKEDAVVMGTPLGRAIFLKNTSANQQGGNSSNNTNNANNNNNNNSSNNSSNDTGINNANSNNPNSSASIQSNQSLASNINGVYTLVAAVRSPPDDHVFAPNSGVAVLYDFRIPEEMGMKVVPIQPYFLSSEPTSVWLIGSFQIDAREINWLPPPAPAPLTPYTPGRGGGAANRSSISSSSTAGGLSNHNGLASGSAFATNPASMAFASNPTATASLGYPSLVQYSPRGALHSPPPYYAAAAGAPYLAPKPTYPNSPGGSPSSTPMPSGTPGLTQTTPRGFNELIHFGQAPMMSSGFYSPHLGGGAYPQPFYMIDPSLVLSARGMPDSNAPSNAGFYSPTSGAAGFSMPGFKNSASYPYGLLSPSSTSLSGTTLHAFPGNSPRFEELGLDSGRMV